MQQRYADTGAVANSLERTLHIGAREIVSDEQQRTIVLFCQHIGKAVAEIETRAMDALAPDGLLFPVLRRPRRQTPRGRERA
jgi:hypothetical protein